MSSDVQLREWKKEDVKQLAHIANNKNIWNNLRDSIPHPYTIIDAHKWIEHCSTQKPALNFAIVYKEILAGSIGCVFNKDIYRKNIEVGYFVGEEYWNLGIATKAVAALINYIKERFDALRLYAEVYAYNKASMHVLHKNGFYLESIRRKSVVKNNVLMDDYVWVKILER